MSAKEIAMNYLVQTVQDHHQNRKVILTMKQEKVEGLETKLDFTFTQRDRDIALLVAFIETLKDAAEDLQPGLFRPLPPSEEATTADAMRITSLAHDLRVGFGKPFTVSEAQGGL